MKKIILLLGLMSCLVSGASAFDVYQSSSIPNAVVTTTPLCAGTTSQYKRGFLHGVCTDFAVAASSFTIFNSTWTNANTGKLIGPVETTVNGCRYYDTDFPSGIAIQKTGTSVITILYRCQ